MPDARLEKVRSDPVAADRLLEQAQVHLASAQLEGLDRESAYGICYQAAATTDRLQRMRRGRNNVFYGSLEISETDLTAALADAESVLEASARRERS